MAGFPNRPIRDNFGPTLEDTFPVTNPKKEIGAGSFNLGWWQLAGTGLVVPRAVLFVDVVAATSATTIAQMIAWDPNQELAFLSWTYVGTGNYDLTFSTQYEDETGTLQTLVLKGGIVSVIDTTDEAAYQTRAVVTGPNTVTVRVYAANGTTAADRDFAVVLW